MIGDLSVRPAPAMDPVASARRTPERPAVSPEPEPGAVLVPADPGRAPETNSERGTAERLRAMLTDPDLRVRTQHDPASGRTVMRFEDRTTGEMVEQLPSEELLKLYAAIREPLIDQEA